MIRDSILIREFQYPSDYGQVVELWREMGKDEACAYYKKIDRDMMDDIVIFWKELA